MITSIDEDLGVTPSAKPLVCEDGEHCDPGCPFLNDPSEDISGKCMKSGNPLDWHDFYMAECIEN
mgnify:CR=1 FL=1